MAHNLASSAHTMTKKAPPPVPTRWERWRKSPVFNNSRARIGIIGLGLMVLAAIFAPLLAPKDPYVMDYVNSFLGPFQQGTILGTDEYGRDVFSRLLYGGRVSLVVAGVSVLSSALIGVALGMIAGYFGGVVDMIIMRLMDVIFCFPPILLAIAVLAFLGNSMVNLIIAITIVFIPSFVRLIYSSVVSIRHEEYVLAARTIGARPLRILVMAVLPNILSPILVRVSLTLGTAVLLESGLSFLGLGTTPPTASWGIMLAAGRGYMTHQLWLVVWPSLAVAITILMMNILGDGLRDALDPKLKR